MQFILLTLTTLLASVLAAPVPYTAPIERCTADDVGQYCNAGEVNGFFVTGKCTAAQGFDNQYVCLPSVAPIDKA